MRVFNMTISEYTQTTPPKEEKPAFNHLATFKFVMLPSFATFLILTAGFYMLAGYTSGKQMEDLKKKLNQVRKRRFFSALLTTFATHHLDTMLQFALYF